MTTRASSAPEPEAAACVHVADADAVTRSLVLDIGHRDGFAVRMHDRGTDLPGTLQEAATDCLLLDLQLPDRPGLEVLRELRERGLQIPVVAIGAAARIADAVTAMKLGSLDFVEKPLPPAPLAAAIQRALTIARERRARERERAALQAQLAGLTPREREVLALVVDGMPNKRIAARLGISPKTIEVHRARVMRKTQASSLADLVRLALAAAAATTAPAFLSGRGA